MKILKHLKDSSEHYRPERAGDIRLPARLLTTVDKETVMMNNKLILKQVVQFNKTAFDNAFKAMKMAHEQGEKMLTALLDQATWIPEEGKKTITEWFRAYKKGVDDFKNTVDEQYKKVDEFFAN